MHQVTEHEYFTKYLSPANPIISKKIQLDHALKLNLNVPTAATKPAVSSDDNQHNNGQSASVQQEHDEEIDRFTLLNGYHDRALVFKKCNNQSYRQRNKKQYFSSIFTDLLDMPSTSPENRISIETNGIKFASDEQSMNLFAVYQTAYNQYDLILQNDVNTCGYTQWFYFSVFNKNKQTIKINIVNLYKSKSLYSTGMKPLAISKKLNKGWQRAGANVLYTDNQINIEHSKKYYRTLSFEHTFLQQNNQTQFAHCYPYSYHTLKQKLKSLQKHPRVKIRSLGATCLKKSIPMVQFSQQDANPNKKALIIMARQHPGETVGSLIMDQILNQLTQICTQNQFLLWRFNIYCIPMVNVDGVMLGNYRGNAYGYDLNRCWDRDNQNKLPQLFHIKKQIRKIQKKYPIQMILDLHGHSRKMGSFFYGNPFGKNTGLYAYIASNMSAMISYENSTFNKEKSQKVTTARVVLGNLIKDTGCFYTYETSFYGVNIQGKKSHFSLENYQELGRVLISSLCKTFMEINKQQKSLKQSLYLKQVRKQMVIFQQQKGTLPEDNSGSDSEAQQLTIKQFQIKSEQETNCLKEKGIKIETQAKFQQRQEKISIEIQVGDGVISENQLCAQSPITNMVDSDLSEVNIKKETARNEKRFKKLGSISQKFSLCVGFQKSQDLTEFSKKNSINSTNNSLNRKNFLLEKLRIFGQTYIEPNPKQTSKETQTGNFYLNIQKIGKKQKIEQEESAIKSPQFRRRKNRNKSLIIRLDNRDKLAMADIVKVNRLEYKRIQRDSLLDVHRRQLQKDFIKIGMLPNIN